MSDVVIRVENLSKSYQLGIISHGTLYHDLQSWWARIRGQEDPNVKITDNHHIGRPGERFWALKDISFEVKQGEILGIIGRNGAGKSTLLKILSKITSPTKGCVKLKGRVGSLLEVGTGFHPELTGRENIYLNGAILGMNKAEIIKKFDEIVDFSGIEEFIDTPVKRYSSGMHVRLAFAVAAHLEPEILLVDEVLAVGDAGFQKKCLGKMQTVANEGRTVMFVSHHMGAISQLCPTCIWLEYGKIRKMATTPLVVPLYLKSCVASGDQAEVVFSENVQKESQLRQVRLVNKDGIVTNVFDCDNPIQIELLYQVRHYVPGLYGYLQILKLDGTNVMASFSVDNVPNPIDGLEEGMYLIVITIPPRTLGFGEYNVYLNFTSLSAHNFAVDSPGIVCTFTVNDYTSTRGHNRPGFFSTLLKWDVSRVS